ncbi:MAG: hypothetical protein ABEJ68_05780 [Halobacteriaceae archaeon]
MSVVPLRARIATADDWFTAHRPVWVLLLAVLYGVGHLLTGVVVSGESASPDALVEGLLLGVGFATTYALLDSLV